MRKTVSMNTPGCGKQSWVLVTYLRLPLERPLLPELELELLLLPP